jgi:predicted  nucleic acid-binding Zn-ribbon protein
MDLRLPNITGATEREQLQQIKSYLHQTVEQLNWALNNIDTQSNTAVVAPTARSLAPVASGSVSQSDPQATFASIKSLIIKSAEIVDAYYDEINARLEGLYVAQSDFGTYVEQTNALLKANSQGITQTYTNVQTLQSNVGDINTAVTTVGGKVTEVEKKVGTVESEVSTVKEDVKNVDGKVDTVAGDATANLQAAKDALQGGINKLSGELSDHETALQDVKKGTEDSIKAVQGSVDGLSSDIDDVKDNVEKKTKELDEAIKATNVVVATVTSTIHTGELYRDEMGLPVFGLEIGQKNTIDGVETFNKYARFIANRLSFYDSGGYEVAYISDSKLYITHAEITSSFKLGGFVDTVMSDGRVVTKWVGGN